MEFPGSWGSESEPEKIEEVETAAEVTGESGRLRGKLIEDLRAKEREDEENSSLLRGKLLEKIAASGTEETPEPSRLRGSLIEKARMSPAIEEEAPIEAEAVPEASRLRGKLLEKSEEPERYSKEWLTKQTFVQRDSGAEFVFRSFNMGFRGEMISLISTKNGATTSQNIERFIERLKTPGEAWSVKED